MAFSSFMNQTIKIFPRDGALNRFGKKAIGATVTVKGRVEEANDLTLSVRGREVTVDATLFLEADVVISAQDRVELPDDPGVEMEVFTVRRCRVGSGTNHHLEVQVGRVTRTAGAG